MIDTLYSTLLTSVISYGYPVIGGMILCAGFAVPLPVTFMLLTAGTLCASGDLNLWVLVFVSSLSAVISDYIGYQVGAHVASALLARHVPSLYSQIETSKRSLDAWGNWVIFFTRWLFTPLGIPINVAAGISNYPLKKFLGMVVLGEVLWVNVYIGIGYAIGANWVAFKQYIAQVPQIGSLLLLGAVCIYIALYRTKKAHQ